MARRNGAWDLLKELDRVSGSATLIGPILCAEKVVKDLQERGPQWTGKFANSWEIRGPQGQVVKGSGTEGKPQPLKFDTAPFTGRQALTTRLRTTYTKDKVVFTISNFSEYADEARDLAPYTPFSDDDRDLGTPIKKRTFGFRPEGGRRGDIQGKGNNSVTAPLDWYSNYFGGGQFGKTIQVTMDKALRTI
jgi:hypothetical protein